MAKAIGEVVDFCHNVEGRFLGLGSRDVDIKGGGIRAGPVFLGSLCRQGGRSRFSDRGSDGWRYIL